MMIISDRRTGEPLFEIPGQSLCGLDMRKFDLRYADLADLDLNGCNFQGMDLEGIQCSNSIMRKVNMEGCNLGEGIFTRIDGTQANFRGSKLLMTAFSYAVLEEADFSGVIIEGMVNFRWIKARRAIFKNIADLNGANFFEADLTDAALDGSDFVRLSESDRTGIIATGTVFESLI